MTEIVLNEYQQEFVDCDDSITVFMAGRGGGKTTAMIEAVRRHCRESKVAPHVLIVGYEWFWRGIIENLNDDWCGEPVLVGKAFQWDCPVIEFVSTHQFSTDTLRWGNRYTFVGIDNLEMLVLPDGRDALLQLHSQLRPGSCLKVTVDPHSHMPDWVREFVSSDRVSLINFYDAVNPTQGVVEWK